MKIAKKATLAEIEPRHWDQFGGGRRTDSPTHGRLTRQGGSDQLSPFEAAGADDRSSRNKPMLSR